MPTADANPDSTTLVRRRRFLAQSLWAIGAACSANMTTEMCHANGTSLSCGDELWMISSRHLGACPQPASADCLDHQRCESGRWDPASFCDYRVACAMPRPTIFYVHGNRSDRITAITDGMEVYRAIRRCCSPQVPLRFVIWAWPSDKVCGLYHDVRVKAARTERQSLILANLMAQTSACGPTTLIGYSYGARLVAGALHLLGGGDFCGESLRSPGLALAESQGAVTQSVLAPIHSVWWAGAFPNRWILPGHHYGKAIQAAGHVRVMQNRHDPVLRRYRRALHEYDGHAIGYVGVPFARQLGCLADRIQICDVTHAVGNRHDWTRYTRDPHIMAATRGAILQG